MTGVEGYVESAASGLAVGLNVARLLSGKEMLDFPKETAIGALSHYISDESVKNFQPMNVNFGLMPPLDVRIKDKKEKYLKISERALKIMESGKWKVESE
jgi:methylenetetrahydrofolate--tRNA-(uracil-5-)-methyltransferase